MKDFLPEEITAFKHCSNSSLVENPVGRVSTSWHVDAITAVDELSNLTVMNPAEKPAGGGLLEPVVKRRKCSNSAVKKMIYMLC